MLFSVLADRMSEGKDMPFFEDLFEDVKGNSSLDFIRPEEIGALTSAPIIGLEVDRGENGDEIKETGRVFWHERYALELAIEVMLEKGGIVLPASPDNKD